jgi:hypothetical protein
VSQIGLQFVSTNFAVKVVRSIIMRKRDEKKRRIKELLDVLNGEGEFASPRLRDLSKHLQEFADLKPSARSIVRAWAKEIAQARMGEPFREWWVRDLTGEKSVASRGDDLFLYFSTLFPDVVKKCARDGCDRWHANKVYCGRRCGKLAFDTENTRRKREELRQEKLARAREMAPQWNPGYSKVDQKTYVAMRTGLTKKFLTRHARTLGLKPVQKQAAGSAR